MRSPCEVGAGVSLSPTLPTAVSAALCELLQVSCLVSKGPGKGWEAMPLCDYCLPLLHWVLRMMPSIARRARPRVTSREGHQPMGPSEELVYLSLRLAKSSQSSSIYLGSHALPVKEIEAMIRNRGSCTQNKERPRFSDHIPPKGIRLNVGLLHTVGSPAPISRSYCYGLRVWFSLEFVC